MEGCAPPGGIVLEHDVFGVEGITTWAGTDPDLDRFSGFSIGANASGLLVCDSNVRTLPDHANYDDLVEIALREGTDVPSGVEAVQAAVASRPYLWGNLVLIDGSTQAAVEVRSQQTAVLSLDGPTARSNHHPELGPHPQDDDTQTSQNRRASALRDVTQASSLEDVFALLTTHDQGDTGVCNHSTYQTVYRYVLRRRPDGITLYVRQGRPCDDVPDIELTLPLGDRWSADAVEAFRSSYPSNRAGVPA